MLKKERRLSREEIEFLKRARNETINFQGNYFGLVYKNNNLPAKFTLIVSKKISRLAVERNQIKRRLFQAIQSKLMDKNGQFLFLAKKSSLNKNVEEIEKEMEYFAGRIG